MLLRKQLNLFKAMNNQWTAISVVCIFMGVESSTGVTPQRKLALLPSEATNFLPQ